MFRAFWIGLLAIAAGLHLTPSTACAAGTTYAVVVGVSRYSDPQIHTRVHAEADAKALYDLFTDPTTLGAPKSQVHLFLGSEDENRKARPATKDNIAAAVKDVVAKATKEDTVLFAFFGQGASLADRTCLLTADANFKDRATTALAFADLEKDLQGIKAEKVVAFVDLNFKGVDPGKEPLLEPNPFDAIKVFVASEDKEEHALPPGRVIFLANGNVSTPVELADHGVFAKVLIDGLKGAADKTGYEPDGLVTVEELDIYIENNALDLARKAQKVKDENLLQTPISVGARTNNFVVTHNPAAFAPAQERLQKLAKAGLPAEVASQGERLLTKMPKLKADQELRKLFQQRSDGKITNDELLAARTKNLDARTLPAEDAATFARKVISAMRMVQNQYVKELEMGEMVGWAVKGMYKRLDEKMPAEIKEQIDNLPGTEQDKLREFLAAVRTKFGQREDLEGYKDVDLAISTMLLNLDAPYTTYIDKESLTKAEMSFHGRFTGIGIQIRRDLIRDGLLVVSPIKDSPGYKAGIKAGDLITEVETEMDANGKPQKERQVVSTKGMKTEDAVKRIVGNPGTKVKVKILRDGEAQPLDFEITRGRVEVETVLGVKRNDDDTWDYMLDPKEKIGYIRLSQFTGRSFADMKAAVKKLEKAGVKGLVLDLRFDPGGLLNSAVEISDLFIDDGKIVSTRPRGKDEQFITGSRKDSYLNFPMVCLVNGQSASGSEIVAACLQDHHRAVIVGERSYGKGSVQTILNFRPTESEIKLTTATFWRPNGKNLNKPSTSGSLDEDWGVRPDKDFEVKLDRHETTELFERLRDQEIIVRKDLPPKESKEKGPDRQLEKGLEYLRSQIKTAAREPLKKAG